MFSLGILTFNGPEISVNWDFLHILFKSKDTLFCQLSQSNGLIPVKYLHSRSGTDVIILVTSAEKRGKP